MTRQLDCRDLACPGPVLQIRDLLEKGYLDSLTVIVDNEAAWQNVTRFLKHQQFKVVMEKQGTDFHVTGEKMADAPAAGKKSAERPEAGQRKIMVLVGTDRLGHGDDGLGAKLLLNFIETLKEMGRDLWLLVFINNGVKLTVEGSAALPTLQTLNGEGVQILVCGTCLTHFNLLDKKKVGATTNMLDIVTAMQIADSVINI